jgi:trehalose 6-phosphate phosphatase
MDELYKKLTVYRNTPQATGIFCDLDGTLSKIAAKPEKAVITREMKSALKNLSMKYGVVAVITGRDAANAKTMIGLDNLIYVGNHGLERIDNVSHTLIPEAENYVRISEEVASELLRLSSGEGVTIEKKRIGVAIHYRLAENKAEAYRQVRKLAGSMAEKYSLRIYEGRNVVEIKPDLKYDKGDAVRDIAEEQELNRAIYFGDDITDIDAFKELKRMRGEGWIDATCVAVSSNEIDPAVAGEADYLVGGVDDVQTILEWMSGKALETP